MNVFKSFPAVLSELKLHFMWFCRQIFLFSGAFSENIPGGKWRGVSLVWKASWTSAVVVNQLYSEEKDTLFMDPSPDNLSFVHVQIQWLFIMKSTHIFKNVKKIQTLYNRIVLNVMAYKGT